MYICKVLIFGLILFATNCKKSQTEQQIQEKPKQKAGEYSDISNFKNITPLDFSPVYTLEDIYNDEKIMKIPKLKKIIEYIISNKESMNKKVFFVIKQKKK